MQNISILHEVRNHIGHLVLNRPQELNALSLNMVQSLATILKKWADDPEIHAVVLRSSSPKAFCAGGDIRALYESYVAGNDQYIDFFEQEYALDQFIYAYPKPVIVFINGYCLGGGMGLVQGATFRVVSDQAKLGMPETAIGYFPDVGGSYFLSRIPGEIGTYLALTGKQLNAADALYNGLADYYVPSQRLEQLDEALGSLLWQQDPYTSIKNVLEMLAMRAPEKPQIESSESQINQLFAGDDLTLIYRRLKHDRSEFAQQALALMEKSSPLAMAVTLELLRRGKALERADCFALELHLDRQWFAHGDIVKGVRVLIIDKDKMPRWSVANIDKVLKSDVAAFFNGFYVAY